MSGNTIAVKTLDLNQDFEIIKIDKSVEPYLNEEYGTAFERKDNNSEFTRIADFSFDTDNGEV